MQKLLKKAKIYFEYSICEFQIEKIRIQLKNTAIQRTMKQSKKQTNSLQSQQKFQSTNNSIDTIMSNLKRYSSQNGNLLQKYNEEFYLSYFDRNLIQNTLFKLQQDQNDKKQLSLHQFIQLFLTLIKHDQNQTIYLAMSLRNLFFSIQEETNNQIGIRFKDFTNYLCQKIAKSNTDIIVPLKQIPKEKITPDVSRIRQIDISPPIMLKNVEQDLPRIAKDKKKKDKKLIERKPVSKFIYNSQNQQIITMGRLSSCIHFYDLQLKKQSTQITPKAYNDMTRQMAILTMDFDEFNQRIGAIINGIGIAFWQASDNFDTKKTIYKCQGDKIFYLRLFKEWITADKNTIYFWDIKEESVSSKIHLQEAVMVNDVCEINHLRCICVSYTTEDDKKPFIVYKEGKPIVRYEMGSSGCHSLHYNISSQLIITAGYHNQLQVFEIENGTYSINLKKQLKGHASIVTCVSDIKNTNFILSGDDSGEVRIWELNFMKCIQVVKVSKYINQLYCTGSKLIFSDSRLNIIQMDKFSLPQQNDEEIIYHFFREQSEIHFIITRKSIRKVNFNNGKIPMIFVVCGQEEEITSAINISSGILIGTSRGMMKLFTTDGKCKWELSAHEREITQLSYDIKTRFIFSLGSDNMLKIWPEKSLLQDGVKKAITFKNNNFNLLTLFNQVQILFLASTHENEISIWDYETLKLLTVIKLSSPVLFMDLNPVYRILMVSTIYDEIYFFKLIWKNGHLSYEIIYNGDGIFSGQKKGSNFNYQSMDNSLYNENIKGSMKKIGKEQHYENENSKKKNLKKTQHKESQAFMTQVNRQKERNTQKKSSIKISINNFQNNQRVDQIVELTPSIKLIKPSKGQIAINQTEKSIVTLKTLKRIDKEITTKMQIMDTQNSCLLIVGNSKGQISCYDISNLIKKNFKGYQTLLKKKESPNRYRPAKEDYDLELGKDKYQSLSPQSIPRLSKVKKSFFKFQWKQQCSTLEPISCICFIEMKPVYICVSMTDGSCKYFELKSGQIKGQLQINLPLPIVWDMPVQKDLYIRRNLHETLIILDSILVNHGCQMLNKECNAINVTNFLQNLKKEKSIQAIPNSVGKIQQSQTKNNKKITLLHQEYSLEDLRKTPQVNHKSNGQNTLKSMQVYKRVKQIKEQMILEIKEKDIPYQKNPYDQVQTIPAQFLRQKQQIQKLLKPNYFSDLGEEGNIPCMNRSVELGTLQERSIVLLERVNESKKKLNSHYSSNKPSQTKIKMKTSILPPLAQIKSLLTQRKYPEIQMNNENNLVNKLSNSLSSSILLKQKDFLLFSINSKSSMTPSLMKNFSSASINCTKLGALSLSKSSIKPYEVWQIKQKEMKIKNERAMIKINKLQDKTTKQILSEINEKLQKYKKSCYSKRDNL